MKEYIKPQAKIIYTKILFRPFCASFNDDSHTENMFVEEGEDL